ncbi:phosphotransferase [Aquihabitans sp. McL0605]|uniref:phosphotransferase n=1 Tax=Aquihabitans sp. McL0605 TaxID=3415671 RepID=UPI003CE70241
MLSSLALVGKELGRVGLDRVLPDRSTLPDRGSDVTTAVLERITGRPAGSIRSVRVLDEHHGTAGRVRIAIDAAPEADLPETLFLKLTPKSPTQRVMMSVFALGTRELLFYSAIADDVPLRVPRCFGAELDARRGRNLMVLEDLSSTAVFRDIREPASAEEAASVVDALADLHAAFWRSDRIDGDLAPLRSRGAAAEKLGNVFVGKVLGKLKGRNAEVIPAEMQRASRIVFEQKEAIDAFWAGEPQTLCHGDTHFGNLFFEGTTPGFLDWQATMTWPGIRDVSYFAISSVDPAVLEPIERGLVDRYAARLAGHGIDLDGDQTWDRYRASASDMYVSAVVTAGTSDRMQPAEISQVGVDRVVAAMARLATFDLLAQIGRDGRI